MKEQHQKQFAGVWMDHRDALLITSAKEKQEYSIVQKVKANEYHGDKGEHAAHNAERSDNRKYFKSIAHMILDYDEILIFGPGKAQEEFRNFLREDNHFNSKKITLDSSAHVTDHQIIARVRDFFEDQS